MSVLSGFKKFKDYIRDDEGNYKFLSRWTAAETVEYADGKSGEQKLTEINNAIDAKVSSDKVGAANGVASLDSAGKLPVSQLPEQAIDRLVKVADDTARFALTSTEVQVGDSVKVIATEKVYIVVDIDKLSSEDGYEEYVSTVSWDSVTSKPTNILYTDDTTEQVTITDTELHESDVVNILTSTETAKPLSANMGKTLNDRVESLINDTNATSATTYSSTKINTLLDGVHGTKSVTQAEYDALSEEEQNNGTIYQITDAEGSANDAKYINYTNESGTDNTVQAELRSVDSSITEVNNTLSNRVWKKLNTTSIAVGTATSLVTNATEYMLVAKYGSIQITISYLTLMGTGSFYTGYYSASSDNARVQLKVDSDSIYIGSFFYGGTSQSTATYDVYYRM